MIGLWRIEGSGVDPELTEGLSVRIADPLWLLARQWQVGEFRAEDAGSPVIIRAEVDCYPLTSVVARGKTTIAIGGPGDPVLEAAVERDAPTPSLLYRERLEAGAALIAALRRDPQMAQTGIADDIAANRAYRMRLPGSADTGDALGLSRLRLMIRSTPDARKFAEFIAKSSIADLKEVQALNPADRPRAIEVIADWIDTEADHITEAGTGESTAWHDRSQSYDFGLLAEVPGDDPIRLTAKGYPGGRLDWQHFDLERRPEELPPHKTMKVEVLASPLRFPGQPALRFWEIENGAVHFGDLAGGPGDLSRSILAAYAAVAGDDWFVVPMRLPTGVVCRISSVFIRDNFEDDPHRIPASAKIDQETGQDRVWRWFEPRGSAEADPDGTPLMVLPPALMTARHGDALEEVRFRRDEMANLAWAIERKYQGVFGRPVTNEMPPPPKQPMPDVADDWTYQLGTEVPGHWFPLVPVRIPNSGGQIVLRRGTMAVSQGEDTSKPHGRLLRPGRPFIIDEAEVPYGGIRVTLRHQMARSADGNVHLWLGRRKRPGQGPLTKSPLSFDPLTGWTPTKRRG